MTQHIKNELFSVRVDPQMKANATEVLASFGLNLSDAVRMLLARIIAEKRLPSGLVMNENEYDVWFKGKVYEALNSEGPTHSHESVMAKVEATIQRVAANRKNHA